MMDPTARGDEIAEKVRRWYEANRESWWDKTAARSEMAFVERANSHEAKAT